MKAALLTFLFIKLGQGLVCYNCNSNGTTNKHCLQPTNRVKTEECLANVDTSYECLTVVKGYTATNYSEEVSRYCFAKPDSLDTDTCTVLKSSLQENSTGVVFCRSCSDRDGCNDDKVKLGFPQPPDNTDENVSKVTGIGYVEFIVSIASILSFITSSIN